MTRFCGILTLAAACALAGCASDNVAWNDQNPDNTMARHDSADYSYTAPGNTSASASTYNNGATVAVTPPSNGARTPDNPQLGQGNDKNAAANNVNLSDADRDFVKFATGGGLYEVNSSQQALLKSSDANVKNIAQHMIDDHTKANSQLQNLASRKGMTAPMGLTADQQAMINKLNGLNGSDFDREYLSQQKSAHQDTISRFQDEANNGKDTDLKNWAASTLPTLRDHLNMINGQQPQDIGTNK